MAIYDPNQQQPTWTGPETPSFTAPLAGIEQTASGDRWALIALAVSLTVLMSCVPILNCLAPFVPLTFGIVALVKAKGATNPSRARTYGWIATGIGILILLVVLAFVGLYGALIYQMLNNPEFRSEFQ